MYHIYISEPKYKNIVEHQRTATTCTILHLKATDTNNDATQSTPPAVKLEHRHSSPPAKGPLWRVLTGSFSKITRSLLCKFALFSLTQPRPSRREPLFATSCCNTSIATWSTPSELPHKKPFWKAFCCCGFCLWSWLAAVVNLFVLNLVCFVGRAALAFPNHRICSLASCG